MYSLAVSLARPKGFPHTLNNIQRDVSQKKVSLDQPRNSIEDNYLELFLYFYRNNEVIKFGQTVIISIISNITIQKPTFSVSCVVLDVTILQRKIVLTVLIQLIIQNL